ncbi:hypothetical protein LCGC14_2770670, partial [marine sediment metagenome]
LEPRLNLLHFENSYIGREDRFLKKRLNKEADAGKLINFALRGLKRLRENRQFTLPPTSVILQKQLKDTGERIIPGNQAFNYSFQHHLFAYRWALNHCSDKIVLDAGCGEGYGSKIIAEKAAQIIGIDKS